MNPTKRLLSAAASRVRAGLIVLAFLAVIILTAARAGAGCQCGIKGVHHHPASAHHGQQYLPGPGDLCNTEFGGTWYWLRSPEQERRVVMNLYNRYCIRCHGVDGRGVWDIPDVPDFTNMTWQGTRPEAYRTRVILEGRGAVMPAFRGTLTLEEAHAMGRYLYSFVPGTQVSRPDVSAGATATPPPAAPAQPPRPAPPPPAANASGPFTR